MILLSFKIKKEIENAENVKNAKNAGNAKNAKNAEKGPIAFSAFTLRF